VGVKQSSETCAEHSAIRSDSLGGRVCFRIDDPGRFQLGLVGLTGRGLMTSRASKAPVKVRVRTASAQATCRRLLRPGRCEVSLSLPKFPISHRHAFLTLDQFTSATRSSRIIIITTPSQPPGPHYSSSSTVLPELHDSLDAPQKKTGYCPSSQEWSKRHSSHRARAVSAFTATRATRAARLPPLPKAQQSISANSRTTTIQTQRRTPTPP
jgi:hypothetical protein